MATKTLVYVGNGNFSHAVIKVDGEFSRTRCGAEKRGKGTPKLEFMEVDVDVVASCHRCR